MGRSAGSEQPASQQGSDVVLVSMPFGPLFQPSMGLSLLKPAIAQLGVTTKLLYFTFRFAELIGASSYLQISEGQPASYDLVGEWIFSAALFGNASSDAEGYIEEVLGKHLAAHEYMKPVSEAFLRSIIEARAKAESFLGECQHSVTKRAPRIVGFTSVFQQQVASLALARRIKAQNPETFIVFGGANCEGIMGIEVLRQFPFVDAVISGEGDLIFPELVRNVLQGEPLSGLQGVYTRDGTLSVCTKTCYTNAPLVCDLDTLPYPDYDDFFEQLGASRLDSLRAPRIPFETSRGCWWGEQAHCTFCGLNGATMVYRSKSCTRAVEELVYLSTKYPGYDISAVDNIMNMKYFKDFIPELVTRRLGVQLFYEVKANLKKWQVQLLRQAGVTTIQPGIESLSTQVLKLMRKGVRAIENIQLLKWCKELGIRPFWNIIWGFPGEGPEEYASMADLIPLLAHLQPPESAAAIRLDRFSPNFECSEQLGFSDVAAYPAYRYIYPLEPAAVANLAYYFTFKYSSPQDVARYTESVVKSIASWKEVSETSDLFFVDNGTCSLIWDLRPVASKPLTVLSGIHRTIYMACDRALTVRQLRQLVEQHACRELSEKVVYQLLQPLIDRGFMIREGSTYLSLAIPVGTYSPGKKVLQRLLEVAETLGQPLGGGLTALSRDEIEVLGDSET